MFRFTHKNVAAKLVIGVTLAVISTLGGIQTARSGEYEPVWMLADSSFMPGDLLDCTVGLDGGPADITITSSPAGVVAYSGTVSSSVTTLSLATNPNAPAGPVTIMVQTSGAVTASDTTMADAADDPME